MGADILFRPIVSLSKSVSNNNYYFIPNNSNPFKDEKLKNWEGPKNFL